MDFDYTWAAVLKIDRSRRDYFYLRDKLAPINVQDRSFSLINAWWLSEINRLFYRKCTKEHSEIDHDETRAYFLAETGFEEVFFINEKSNQCALLESPAKDFAVMVFRGSDSCDNWITNFIFPSTKWPYGGRVHRGFKTCFERLDKYIPEYLEARKKIPMIFTGHSLGAALATLAASKYKPDQLYTFGSPRVGNTEFLKTLSGIPSYRVQNNIDFAPYVPFEKMGFKHAGELYFLNRMEEERIIKCPLINPVNVFGPPPIISDHAPFNYSLHLSKLIEQDTESSLRV